ncbi:MAG: hypothetical protein V5A25_08730 [Halovenus sp.]
MSWQVVAKKDFRDAVRSRAFLGLSAIFLLLVVGIAVLYGSLDELSGTDPDALGLIFFVASSIGTFVSVAAIVVCYRTGCRRTRLGACDALGRRSRAPPLDRPPARRRLPALPACRPLTPSSS